MKNWILTSMCAGLLWFSHTTESHGQSWRIIHERPPESSDIYQPLIGNLFFVNDSVGWVTGAKGFVHKTIDAGNTWIDQSFGSSSNFLYEISFSDAGVVGGVCGSTLNKVYKTINGGNSWILASPIDNPAPISSSPADIQFVSPDTAWLITTAGVIHRSVNGGMAWSLQAYYPGIIFYDLCFVNKNEGWACGHYSSGSGIGGVIFKTQDGGGTWVLNYENMGGTTGIFRTIYFINEEMGWATGTDNQIFKTVDGGNNWASAVIDPALGDGNAGLVVHGHFFVNDTLGWLSGLPVNGTHKSLVYMTLNGGATWQKQSIERIVQ